MQKDNICIQSILKEIIKQIEECQDVGDLPDIYHLQ